MEAGDDVGAARSWAEDVANKVGVMGGRHCVPAGDFDAEGAAGKTAIGDGEINSYEGIGCPSITDEDIGGRGGGTRYR